MSHQIGYSLIFDSHYDFGKVLLCVIGDRLTTDRDTIYYARFCHLLFSYCFPNVPFANADTIDPIRLNKRVFKDIISRDGKKTTLPPLRIPAQATQLLIDNLPTMYN